MSAKKCYLFREYYFDVKKTLDVPQYFEMYQPYLPINDIGENNNNKNVLKEKYKLQLSKY